MWTVDDLETIQKDVHSRFTYVPDIERWKTMEYWISRLDGDLLEGKWEGDCDDFALLCRAALREKVIPNRLVFCYVPPEPGSAGGYHLVTEVDGWLFDCRFPYVTDRGLRNYQYIGMSGFNKGDPWHWIKK